MEQNKNDIKPNGEPIVNFTPAPEPMAEELELPFVKRMIVTLDKFLDRRIAGIVMFYFALSALIGVGLFMNTQSANASAGQTAVEEHFFSNAWLYSLLGVATFIFALIAVRVISIRVQRAKRVK